MCKLIRITSFDEIIYFILGVSIQLEMTKFRGGF